MFRRSLSFLLVSLLLGNQCLSVAHAHLGSDFAEPEGHGARPHFHLGGHAHEELDQHSGHAHGDHPGHASGVNEHDATAARAVAPLGEHDSDAVYCGQSTLFPRNLDSPSILVAKCSAAFAVLDVVSQGDRLLRPGPLSSQLSSLFDEACPIYLRTLSLRI